MNALACPMEFRAAGAAPDSIFTGALVCRSAQVGRSSPGVLKDREVCAFACRTRQPGVISQPEIPEDQQRRLAPMRACAATCGFFSCRVQIRGRRRGRSVWYKGVRPSGSVSRTVPAKQLNGPSGSGCSSCWGRGCGGSCRNSKDDGSWWSRSQFRDVSTPPRSLLVAGCSRALRPISRNQWRSSRPRLGRRTSAG